ncbi:MAG TPA: HEAT repeat domain-containing protein [Acidimicrobiales bacterium]|nr:HEAT repeat domain-containing protein [Acidimicrobiales bacterium]
MWRKFGGVAYATLTLAVFTIQAIALVLLTWAFIFDRLGVGPEGIVMRDALALAVAVTALAVMLLTAYTLVYQALSAGRLQRERKETEIWRQRWIRILFSGEEQPPEKLNARATEALVNVREKLTGREAETVDSMISSSGIIHDLVAVATSGRRHSVARRLDALDLLARAGAPMEFDALARLTKDPEVAIRVMALRALARAAASLENPDARQGAAVLLVDLIRTSEVPAGAVEESLLVLGPAADEVFRRMLESPDPPDLLAAALDAIGRLHSADLIADVTAYLDSHNINVRCAAWRAIDGIGLLPAGCVGRLHAALSDPSAQIRAQACRAARLLPPADALARLDALLTDSSWWVRRGAATSLGRMGEVGIEALTAAGQGHRDRFARHIALDVLVEMDRLNPELALSMRASG